MKSNQGEASSNLPLSCFTYAAGHEDEGVCLQMRLGKYRILLDCGMQDLSPLLQDESPADFIFCSHAHDDHCRGLFDSTSGFSPKFPFTPVKLRQSSYPAIG